MWSACQIDTCETRYFNVHVLVKKNQFDDIIIERIGLIFHSTVQTDIWGNLST